MNLDLFSLSCCDAFAGMGGWSIGFHREGFSCYGFDIVDAGYPYDLHLEDVKNITGADLLRWNGGRKPTVLVISPPCVEFSQITKLSALKGQRDMPDPEKGMILVREGMRLVKELNPRYWLLENVMPSRKYISKEFGEPKLVSRPWVLWGRFPQNLFEREPVRVSKGFHSEKDPTMGKWVIGKNFRQLNDWTKGKGGNRLGLPEDFAFDPLRSWKRARVPVWLGQSMAKAIRAEMMQVPA